MWSVVMNVICFIEVIEFAIIVFRVPKINPFALNIDHSWCKALTAI